MPDDTPTTVHSTEPAGDPPPSGPPGYELRGEVGRGGMGVVHRARDVAVGREVAVKLLRDHYPPAGRAARLFREEARITGQLQHPGIPAVHQVGELADGRPFLAMKLVKGDTLDALLKRDGPGGRWLGVFEKVCEAVAYAHDRGVIHRDLKPQNVMVGAFGEVQVMDWGLAKVLGDPQPAADPEATAAATEIDALRADSDHTRDGQALGTVPYMPPEQALGVVADMDRRSDVFGLGAVLCHLLTGHPPYVGGDAASTRLLAARADQADAHARLAGCGADPAVVALCRRCLSGDRAGRPADAGEVAAAVVAIRQAADDRARRAEVSAAEGRVRRRLQLRLGGLVLAVAVVGGSLAGVQWQRARRDRAAAQAAEVSALKAWERTAAALSRLTDEVMQDRLAGRAVLTDADRRFLQDVADQWEGAARDLGDSALGRTVRTDGLRRVADLRSRLGQWPEAEAAYRTAIGEIERLLAEALGGPVLTFADGTAITTADLRFGLASARCGLADVLLATGRREEAVREYDLAEAAHDQLTADPVAGPDALKLAYLSLGSLTLRVLRSDPDSVPKAEAVIRRVLAGYDRAAAAAPADPAVPLAQSAARYQLAVLLTDAGRFGEAERECRAAADLARPLATGGPNAHRGRDALAAARAYLGSTLSRLGRLAEAEPELRAARDEFDRLAADYPGLARHRVSLALTQQEHGTVLRALGRAADGEAAERAAATLYEALAAADPGHRTALADAHLRVAHAAGHAGRPADALRWCDEAVQAAAPAAVADPKGRAVWLLREGHIGRGRALQQLGRAADAVAAWDRAVEVSPAEHRDGCRAGRLEALLVAGQVAQAVAEADELADRHPWDAVTLYNFGCVYAVGGAADRAMTLLRRAVAAGYAEAAHMAADADLASLRGRLDFRWLMAKLRAKSQQPAGPPK